MSRGRGRRRSGVLLPLFGLAVLGAWPLSADEPITLPPLQPGDDVVRPLDPVDERTPAEWKSAEALAHFMAGRLHQSRDDLRAALDEYKKAAELDPTAIQAVRAIIPLALSLDLTDDAIEYALKAAEQTPEDYEVLRQLGELMVRQQRIEEAIDLFSRATRLESLDPKSWAYVALHRDLGLLQFSADQPQAAADAYSVVFDALLHPDDYDLTVRQKAELMSDNRTSYERIAEVFLAAKRPRDAKQALDLAAKNRRGTPGHLAFELAQVHLQLEEYDQALDELQKYFGAQRQSKGQAAYALLKEILEAKGAGEEYLPRLEKLLDSDPHNVPLLLHAGQAFLEREQYDRAQEVFERAIKDGAGIQGQLGLAALYRRTGNATALLDTLATALSQTSGDDLEALEAEMNSLSQDEAAAQMLLETGAEKLQAEPPGLSFEQAYILAKIAVAAEKTDEAAAFYTFALPRSGNRARLIYSELGQLYTDADRYGDAADVYEQAVEDPSQAAQRNNYLLLLSQVREMNGETEKALEAIRDAQQAVPNHPLLEFQEAWIYYHARDWDKAIEKYEEVIEQFPNVKDIVRRSRFSLSNIYVQQGDIRKGEEILEQILEEDPDDPGVNNDLGYLYADQGKNLEKAEQMIRKAVAAEPDNAAYLDSLGWVLYRLGKFEEAIEPLEKAVEELDGRGDSTILDHLGDVYHALGRQEDAVKAWKQALESARQEARPDESLIEKIEAKLAAE